MYVTKLYLGMQRSWNTICLHSCCDALNKCEGIFSRSCEMRDMWNVLTLALTVLEWLSLLTWASFRMLPLIDANIFSSLNVYVDTHFIFPFSYLFKSSIQRFFSRLKIFTTCRSMQFTCKLMQIYNLGFQFSYSLFLTWSIFSYLVSLCRTIIL